MYGEEWGDDEAEEEVTEGQVQDVQVGGVVGALVRGRERFDHLHCH